ncbi:MAG TPA: DUF397 domain-containing protein [Mycobacteriales bacterium]|nr:DUF397 domain-containing protein [Mycobacteriales bacterium]
MTTNHPDQRTVTDTPWIKARASNGNGGNCVELRRHGAQVEIRDSKNPTGPTLHFTPTEFATFLTTAKTGEFDPT